MDTKKINKVTQFISVMGQTILDISAPMETVKEVRALYEAMIDEEACELCAAIKPVDVLDAIADILYVGYGYIAAMGPFQHLITEDVFAIMDALYTDSEFSAATIDKAFDRVHESNMTKLCRTEAVADMTIEANRERYPTATKVYMPAIGKWKVYEAESGKVIKSIEYVPVQLADLVNLP
jgi:predicted HAD superfamily Cof-like phosphohydrolase